MEDAPTWFSYLMNGFQVATFITVIVLLWKFARWTGQIDEKFVSIRKENAETKKRADRAHGRIDKLLTQLAGGD